MIDQKKQMCFEKMKMKQRTDQKIVNKTLGKFLLEGVYGRKWIQEFVVSEKRAHGNQIFGSQ